jgi:hypothetical protein
VNRIEAAGGRVGRQIAKVSQFLARQAGATERFIGKAAQRRGGEGASAERLHTTVDRCGGFGGQLLINDRARDELEVRSVSHRSKPARADLFDDLPSTGSAREGVRAFRCI